VLTYAYDGDGNKVAWTDGAGTLQCLNDIATALPVTLEESGPEGSVSYAYGLGLLLEEVTKPALVPEAFFYLSDGLGSTVALTDSQGRSQASYEYDEWGNLDGSTGSVPNRFLFTGEERDPETGLYYLRARWYDSAVGRLLTRDPFAGVPTRPVSLNRYVYVRNNPARFSDPFGLSPREGIDVIPPYPTTIEEAIRDPARRALWHDPGLPRIGVEAGVLPRILPTSGVPPSKTPEAGFTPANCRPAFILPEWAPIVFDLINLITLSKGADPFDPGFIPQVIICPLEFI
jgi:RHS repeat-associated protein